ncbi:MAG: hypothetical protein WCO31_03710, partial [Actinomycetes bacterium]
MSLTADGVLAGTPSEVGLFCITVAAVDSFTGSSYSGTGSYSIVVGADNGAGKFTIPPTKWTKVGKGIVQPDGSFLLTPNTPNILGAVSMPFAFNVSDFTVEANIDFGTSKGDGVAIAFLDPASTKSLGAGGRGMGISGLTGSAVVFDQHKNTESGDPSGNFIGVSQQPRALSSFYSATSVMPTAGSTNLLGVHAVSIHILQSNSQWIITVSFDGVQKLETNLPLGAITPSAILSFIGSNGTAAGLHAVSNVRVTTPERAPACLATNTTRGTLAASLQAAVDNASFDDNIVITGVCGATTINNGQIHLTGRGANASINGGLNIGSSGGTVYLRGLHIEGGSHAGMTGQAIDIQATNVIFENGLTGIEIQNGSLSLTNCQISNNADDGTFGAGGMLVEDGASVVLNNSSVHENSSSATMGSGGIWAKGFGNVDLNGSVILNNAFTGSDAGGGGMTLDGETHLNTDGTLWQGNSTSKNGGALLVRNGGNVDPRSTNAASRFIGNSAQGLTGGVLIESPNSYWCGGRGPLFAGNTDTQSGPNSVGTFRDAILMNGTLDINWPGQNLSGAAALQQMYNWC